MLKVTGVQAKLFRIYTAQQNLFPFIVNQRSYRLLFNYYAVFVYIVCARMAYFLKYSPFHFLYLFVVYLIFYNLFKSCYFLFFSTFSISFSVGNLFFCVQIYKSQKYGNFTVIENKLTGNFLHICVCAYCNFFSMMLLLLQAYPSASYSFHRIFS